jgi:hypothetical protein
MMTRVEPNLKMEVEVSSETLVTTQKITLCHSPNADCRKELIVMISWRSAPLWPLLRRYTAASSVRCYEALDRLAPTVVSICN